MKSKKQKQPYSLLQNVGWMLSIGWNTRRRGLTFCLLIAIADVLANVSQLYIAPDDGAGGHKNGGMDIGLFHGKRILSVFFHIVPRFFRITSVSGKIS